MKKKRIVYSLTGRGLFSELSNLALALVYADYNQEELTALFGFNIPQRWSIAHLYQAMLNGEPHVKEISFLTTLAGFLHWKLTGEKRMGVGEASGMFPIGRGSCAYDKEMVLDIGANTSPTGSCGNPSGSFDSGGGRTAGSFRRFAAGNPVGAL